VKKEPQSAHGYSMKKRRAMIYRAEPRETQKKEQRYFDIFLSHKSKFASVENIRPKQERSTHHISFVILL